MFTYYKNLYLGKTINIDIRNMIRNKTSVYGVFLICIREDDKNNLMEIFHFPEIMKPFYKKNIYKIIGIGNGRKETEEVLIKIVHDFIKKGTDFKNFKNYFYP